MGYLNFKYRFIRAASVSAIVWTASPVWPHAPEYHAPSEPEEVSTPTQGNPTSEPDTTSETTTCTTEATCSTDREPSPAEKISASSLPTGEFVLLLLAAAPSILVGFKQRWQQQNK